MTSAVDSNIFVALWDIEHTLHSRAQSVLDAALQQGNLVVGTPVYAELLAFPRRTEAFLDYFFKETGIAVDWELNESDWRTAGRAFRSYAARRSKQRDPGPRRILTDFLIGAHALRRGYRLLTLDDHLYRAAFPRLPIIAV
jgi:predicted nucleic acid-binding protein